jgi:hypothetical protein
VNGKGKDRNNDIYNWLLAYQVHALKHVAFFNSNIFYGLWQTQAIDRWEERKDNVFYQFLHHREMLDIQWVPPTIGESFPMCICKEFFLIRYIYGLQKY